MAARNNENNVLTTIGLAKRLAADNVLHVTAQAITGWVGHAGYPQPVKVSQRPGQPHQWRYSDVLRWVAEGKSRELGPRTDERESRRRKLAADASLAELELAERQGQVARIDDMTAQWGQMIVAAKSCLLGMGYKLAPAVAIESDPVTCQALINAEVHEALHELAKYNPSKTKRNRSTAKAREAIHG
jgi:hypothetical protein